MKPTVDLGEPEELVAALSFADKPIAVLVGAPLSAPDQPDGPGVPGVAGMLELIRARALELGVSEPFAASRGPAGPNYAEAIATLRRRTNQETVNDVVRRAVVQARLAPPAGEFDSEALERDAEGWYLPLGTEALGTLLVRHGERFAGPVLTTNFDPLLSIAIRRERGIPVRTVVDADGGFGRVEADTSLARSVIHLHGYWRASDTMHSPDQLTAARPKLNASLARLLRGHVLLVLGYGGWDDVFTRALSDVVNDDTAPVDVLWAFHEDDPDIVAGRYDALLHSVRDARTGVPQLVGI